MGRYNYTNALTRLSQWAYKEGYHDISFDHYDVSLIDWKKGTLNEPNLIKIEGRYTKELQVYLFLHELGHHQLRKDWDKFERVLPISAEAEYKHIYLNLKKYKRRVTYLVSCMDEEFKAWDEGYKLGIRLGIRINEVKWLDLKSWCLMQYMRYYSSKKFR
jgi:hypothetical protein